MGLSADCHMAFALNRFSCFAGSDGLAGEAGPKVRLRSWFEEIVPGRDDGKLAVRIFVPLMVKVR